jgi:hypothetical protein
MRPGSPTRLRTSLHHRWPRNTWVFAIATSDDIIEGTPADLQLEVAEICCLCVDITGNHIYDQLLAIYHRQFDQRRVSILSNGQRSATRDNIVHSVGES